MTKGRLEAFSDGVIAILITIMVLELKVPTGTDWTAIQPVLPLLMIYLLSFLFLGIYWNNHHHMLHTVERVNGAILWANLHLLFWLSLIPFGTAWMGENHFAPLPTAAYGVVLFFAGVAYAILESAIVRHQGQQSKLKAAVGKDLKARVSMALYFIAIPTAFFYRWISLAIYVFVALLWLIPDRRIEKTLSA